MRADTMGDAMGQRIFQVDAFTDRPYAGNPAGVCVLEAPREDEWMQCVAREMNVSETAFLEQRAEGFDLRWFTPRVEVDLCGHATLASAHVLWQEGHLAPDEQARFHTRSGLLEARSADDFIELDFPAYEPRPLDPPPALVQALGVTPEAVARFDINYLLAQVDSEETVRALDPDLALLATLPDLAVTVTSRASTPGYDFVSRAFAPNAGIAEDRSPDPPTAAWVPSGASGSARTSSSPTRRRPAAAWCACESRASGCAWAVRRSRCCEGRSSEFRSG